MFDLRIQVFNDSKWISRINTTVSTKVDLKELRVSFSINGKTKQSSKEFDKLVLRGNADTCNITKGMMGSFMSAVVRELFMEYSNYRFVCPLKKGFYYVFNFPAISEHLFPTYILGISGEFKLTLIFKAKVENVKGLINLGTVIGIGFVSVN